MSLFEKKLTTPIKYVKGVGPQRAELLKNLGIESIEDALFTTPFRYEDRSAIVRICDIKDEPTDATIVGKITRAELTVTPQQRKKIFNVWVSDGTGYVVASYFNQAFLKDILVEGRQIVLSGRTHYNRYLNNLEILHPEYEILDEHDALIHTGRVVPIYHLTKGVTQKSLRRLMFELVENYAGVVTELLPQEVRSRRNLLSLSEAIRFVHFPYQQPGSPLELAALNQGRTEAHRRLAYEELFLMQAYLLLHKSKVREPGGRVMRINTDLLQQFLAILPFELTSAQRRVLREISSDIKSPYPMNRLLQGEVGCGKTIVALITMIIAVSNGYQAALMAPTEVLAEQHAINIRRLLKPLGLEPVLLISGLGAKEKRLAHERISQGCAQITIGTHALIQETVNFANLGLIVVDEQHRFGVLHRVTLKQKGAQPQVLVMTATPIPRSLSLTVFGHLDVSTIDEMPAGRIPVITKMLKEKQRELAYDLITQEINAGHQVFIIYPLVAESERVDLKDACSMHHHLQNSVFPALRIGLLHGRMKTADKEQVMAAFAAKQLDILVSTTVIEVGIDIKNATVMMIEHAERFGLAQLHQLRGRVGRGPEQAYCLLMVGGRLTALARQRLQVLVASNDGFKIAEEDLLLRGPGEILGTKQSGGDDLKLLNLVRYPRLLDEAREDAAAFVNDPLKLTEAVRQNLNAIFHRRWHYRFELLSSG